MPIDLLSQRKSREDILKGLVSGRDIEDELSRTSTGIGNLRNRFLGRAGGLISGVSPTGRSSVLSRIPEVDVKTKAILAQRKLALQRQKYQAVFNNAFEMAQQYGLDERGASEYARKFAEQSRQQEFTASQSEKDRAYRRRLDAMADEYTGANVALQNEFAPERDYSALLGVILGTGTEVGLNELFRRNRGKTTESSAPATRGGYLTESSGFTPYTLGASGRQFKPYTGNLDYSRISRPIFR